MVLNAYVFRHLLKPELVGTIGPAGGLAKAWVGPLSYLVGFGRGLGSAFEAAFGIYLLTPLFYITPPAPRK